ncbi:ATP-dependent helicase HrpA [Spraguea lophii 42_110]|uniref:ATP-dependent helicase HrpA n=1 Tax=Spraguea lophii (strain 42_110) TaxID=1358809 RepID=S7W6Q7_SPRLO|nr:ATP-dependent helicase HrpA [Spraguea lophii 42_110]
MKNFKDYEDQIINIISRNKVTIISGPTGCGKSTIIPQILSKKFAHKKIVMIEPRRIAVSSLFNFLQNKIQNIGYKMRFNKKINKNTKVTIMTDGMFINELLDGRLNEYDYVILDEIHERSIRIDCIISILKNSNWKGKLILMSATIEQEKLIKYFNAEVFEFKEKGYKANVFYEDEPIQDYINESYLKVKKILEEEEKNRDEIDNIFEDNEEKNKEKKDILIFLPGEEDINELFKLLKRIPAIKAYKIHSTLTDKEQNKIFEETKFKKVILSTNICETSVTIPGIRYVIDCGLYKTKIYDEIDYMGIKEITIESAEQRKGRCNRLGEGYCYRLYTEEKYTSLKHNIPEIMQSDLSYLFLSLIKFGINILNTEYVDKPSLKNVNQSLKFLLQICAITMKNNIFEITKYGEELVKLPLDIKMGNFFLTSKKYNCAKHCALLISVISQENFNFFEDLKNKKNKDDILYLIDTVEAYLVANNKLDFCREYKLNMKAMIRAELIYEDLKRRINHKDSDIKNLQKTFCEAFRHNKAQSMKDGSYIMLETQKQIFIHPKSSYFRKRCKFITFLNVLQTTKPYAKIITKFLQ